MAEAGPRFRRTNGHIGLRRFALGRSICCAGSLGCTLYR